MFKELILNKYKEQINSEALLNGLKEKEIILKREFWKTLVENIGNLPEAVELIRRNGSLDYQLSGKAVSIGTSSDLNDSEQRLLKDCINKLIPWRKGPFQLFGNYIDSEWQSNLKWERIENLIGNIRKKRILDLGCGNAYYIWRILGKSILENNQPEFILGLDPSEYAYYAYNLVCKFINSKIVDFLPFGVEQLNYFPEFFDLILFLGVIYHRKDPLTSLIDIRNSLRPCGKLILESQTYPSDESTAFFPPERYAKARNVYFIPTANCLKSWLHRAGFKNIEIIREDIIDSQEQRKTTFAPFESLEDFLDPNDHSKTIEGYPAPKRAIVVAVKQ